MRPAIRIAVVLVTISAVETVLPGANVRPAQATEVGGARRFGLGFQLGDPTAITGKVFLGGENALDFGLGFWGYGYGRCWNRNDRAYYTCDGGYGRLSLHGDYL